MNVKKISRKAQLWGALAVLGTVAVAPLLSTPYTAQAQTRNARQQTVRATVLKDLAGQKDFSARLDGGRVVEVVTRQAEPPRLSQGDRVELTGHYDGNLFIARTVRILHDAGPGSVGVNSNNIALRGTVAADLAGNKNFTLRLDNGRVVEVVTLQKEPAGLSQGDRVELTGYYDGNLFIARTVRILQQAKTGRASGRNRGNPNHPWADFTGTVLSVQSAYQLQVRANNGVKYEVRSH
ncbi:MAG TPA: hypothetical protein VNA16_03505, partial [Abditibacteriaceae bacterium]|nr:hypothetical protein [Abditibacteriaceae bacterium]